MAKKKRKKKKKMGLILSYQRMIFFLIYTQILGTICRGNETASVVRWNMIMMPFYHLLWRKVYNEKSQGSDTFYCWAILMTDPLLGFVAAKYTNKADEDSVCQMQEVRSDVLSKCNALFHKQNEATSWVWDYRLATKWRNKVRWKQLDQLLQFSWRHF